MTQNNTYRSMFIFIFLLFMGCSHVGTSSMGKENNSRFIGFQNAVQIRKDKMRLRNQMYLQIDTWRHTALQEVCLRIRNKTIDKQYKKFLTFLCKTELSDADRKCLRSILASKNYHTKRISDGIPMPIWVAVAHGNIELVKILLENAHTDDIGVNDVFGVTDFIQVTPLMVACGMGCSEIVKYLLQHKHTKVNYTNLNNDTQVNCSDQGKVTSVLQIALEYAILTKDITCIKLLMAHETDSIPIDNDYGYALFRAVAGRSKEIVKILLEEAEKKDKDKLITILNTPLPPFTEVEQNEMPTVNLIGDKPLPLPILLTIGNNSPDMLELLLKHGANPSVAIDGHMPISHLMSMVRSKFLNEGTESISRMMKLLVDYYHNYHPIYKGMDSKKRESLQDLLSLQSIGGYSILYEAVAKSNFELIEMIKNESFS